MTEHADKPDLARQWFGPAAATAAVAAVFCAIVAGVLVHNYTRMRGTDLRDSDELTDLKQKLFKRPGDPALQDRIRRLDLQLRLDYFRRRRLAATGGWLLLGGALAFLTGLKAAAGLRKKPPAPVPTSTGAAGQTRARAAARWSVTAAAVVVACAGVLVAVTARSSLDGLGRGGPVSSWARFRGPGGAGISARADAPTSWNGKTGEGILWKTPVPLPGENSPVVWGDRVFLTGATKDKREVYCFDADTGELLWQRPVVTDGSGAEPPDVMDDTGYAAPTAVVDGRRVYAIFANGDLACFDFDGEQVWVKSLGVPENNYGHASSLAMYRHLLLVQYDQGTDPDALQSQVIALDGPTGGVAWVADRDVANSWTTPIVAETAAGPQLITSADPWVIAYNPADGEELWRVECMAGDVAPSPVHAAGLVFAVNAEANLVAIRTDGRGDVTKTHIAWEAEDGLPDICSPLWDGKRLYLLTTDGVMTCYDTRDEKKLWEHEFDTTFNSSPSLAGDRVYLVSQGGVTYVIAAADAYSQIATAELGENCNTCPAFVDGRIYLRGKKHLFCIGRAVNRRDR